MIVEEELDVAKDGTVDKRGHPARKSLTGGWKICPFILGNECCERLAYYGISTNMVVYMTNHLGQRNATAATNVNNWSGTCYITPLIGAFLADTYLGRYRIIAIFSGIYFVGMLFLTLSASLPTLKPHCDTAGKCSSAAFGQLAFFYISLYLIALGTGGIKPCVSSFGADQFDDSDTEEGKQKKSFFNWFYWSINIGALVSSSILVYIQDEVSMAWGFGIPTAAMAIAIVSFFCGTNRYRYQLPGGSPLTRAVQVVVAAVRKWDVETPLNNADLHEDLELYGTGRRRMEHTDNFKFLDKAAVVVDDKLGTKVDGPWRLSTVTQVEELKMILRILPIWGTGIVFSTVYSQMSALFVEQGGLMNTYVGPSKFKIPPASLSIFDTLSVIIWVPIYDFLLVPLFRRLSKKEEGISQLRRMGVGLVISIFAMIFAAVVEIKRLNMVWDRGLQDADISNNEHLTRLQMSIFWQVPQYFLIGAAEVFTFIGQLEFFYQEAPDSMRSLMSALSLTTNALGSYLSSLLVTIVMRISKRNGNPGWIADNLNYGHMDYFFWLLAILSLLNFFIYLICASFYKYKRVGKQAQ